MRESGHGVDMIGSFDIAEEKFMKVLPFPIPPNYFLSAVLVLGISGFYLCLFGNRRQHGKLFCSMEKAN
jgi:hypothetical protein